MTERVAAQYAIVAFPETAALETIETLRRRYDPMSSLLGAHITLVFPFVAGPSSAALRSHVERTLADVEPIELCLAGVSAIDDEYIFLNVEAGRDRVIDLHDRLYTGVLAAHLSREHVYRPHITLGRLKDRGALADALAHAMSAAPVANAIVREVAVFRLDGPDRGEVEFTIALSSRA
jgi:2'-5' RNA ligase